MDFDYAACWQAMKADLVSGERSRGRDKLLARMAEIETQNVAPEGQQGYSEDPAPRSQTEAATGQTARMRAV